MPLKKRSEIRYPRPMIGGEVRKAEPTLPFSVGERSTLDYFEYLLWEAERNDEMEVVMGATEDKILGFVWPHGEDYQAIGLGDRFAIWQTRDEAFEHVHTAELLHRMQAVYRERIQAAHLERMAEHKP
jgi:hypothetical protein